MYYLRSRDNNNYNTALIKTTTIQITLKFHFLKGNALFLIK